MIQGKRILQWVSILSAVMMVSCAGQGTKLTRKHLNEAFVQRPLSDILVIGVSHREDNRRLFEERFAAVLKEAGIDAVGGAQAVAVSSELKLEKEQIKQAAKMHGCDGVIITHLADIQQKEIFTRGATLPTGYYDYYGYLVTGYRDTGYSSGQTTVWLETSLFDVATESLVWSAVSETWKAESGKKLLSEVIREMVRDLIEAGVVAPGR